MLKRSQTPRDVTGHLSDILEASKDGIAIFDHAARLVACNRRYRQMLQAVADLVEPDVSWRVLMAECVRRGVYANGEGAETAIIARAEADLAARRQGVRTTHADGRSYEVSYSAASGGGFVVTQTDITDCRRGDTRLRDPAAVLSETLDTDPKDEIEREALIRLVVEACPAPILMIRATTGEILFRSPQAIQLFGDKARAQDFYVAEMDRADFLAELRRHREVAEYRLRLKDATGAPCWCAVSARLIQWDGEEVIVSHSRDLTGQLAIEAELSRQREQIFQNEKMSALSGLLAGVAHELNNPLSVVVGRAMMLADETRDPESLHQIKKIKDAAERCAKIVRTFLTMSKQEPLRMERINIGEVVETALDVARYGNPGRHVRIEMEFGPDLPEVCADADQITQAVVNLVLNAEQAIETAGVGDTVRVLTRVEEEAGELTITVADNGPGIPPDIRARVFEPYFTTKGIGQGTGIGLAVCHRVVTAHNGTIAIEDVVPHGARFTISLPAAPAGASRVSETDTMSDEPAKVRVLVIDDESDVADLNVEVLERGGYEADAAYRADAAFEMLRSGRYDVVLSDLNMPDTDGRAVFERIAAEFPDLVSRTGFVTGDTMGTSSQRFLSESKRPYIEKPVSPKELRAFVALLSAEGTPA